MANEPADLFSFLEISTELAKIYGSTGAKSIADCKRFINKALLRISRKGAWPFLKDLEKTITTVNGTKIYTLPGVIKAPKSLYFKDNARKLTLLDEADIRDFRSDDDSSTGTPVWYYIAGFNKASKRYKVGLYPTPDSARTLFIDGQTKIPLLEDDDDDIREVSGIPDHLLDMVMEWGEVYAYKSSNDTRYRQQVKDAIEIMEDAWGEENSSDDRNAVVGRDQGSFDVIADDPILPPQFGR